MAAPHELEIRERAVQLAEAGWSRARIIEALGVGKASIGRWRASKRDRGTVEPLPMGGSESKLDEVAHGFLRSVVEQYCSTPVRQMKILLLECLGVDVGTSTVQRALERMGLSYKKKTYRVMGTGPDEARIEQERARFLEEVLDLDLDHAVFIDEAASNLEMDLHYGRAPIGERAYDKRIIVHGKKSSPWSMQ